ncbi:AbrB/MazE/SpoVT family DNA-binding domain-containing protein [Natronomonas sp. LN261]|uniref:AbrB/MazE/SpoVT family DNA-binding domain-containing protein n=1 Tax=Natronomonas sp. LN261 TaxID=2750669 RepID=UPI0015EF4C06|nr:AbrB/MazE/SpoVT family DNA-binding domain-containing protein [Natronomonas sp. LN261]
MLEGARKIGMEVQEIGNSEGVVIPVEWREDLNIDSNDTADAEYDREDRTVTFHF